MLSGALYDLISAATTQIRTVGSATAASSVATQGLEKSADPLVVALIAGGVSLLAAALSLFGVWYSQSRQAKASRDIEVLRDKLESRRDEDTARRDYEFEARKRLYAECEPLLFQLNEDARGAINRVKNLAHAARDGSLSGPRSWFNVDYYVTSTVYYLLAPMAVYPLLRSRLTLVDVRLDGQIRTQYLLSKIVHGILGNDYAVAHNCTPKLKYDPNVIEVAGAAGNPPKLSAEDEAHYSRQGVLGGKLDGAISTLITDAHGRLTIRPYHEFADRLAPPEAIARTKIGPIRDILIGFNPRTRPVTWRLLLGLLIASSLVRSQARLTEAMSPRDLKVAVDELSPCQVRIGTSKGAENPDAEFDAAKQLVKKLIDSTFD